MFLVNVNSIGFLFSALFDIYSYFPGIRSILHMCLICFCVSVAVENLSTQRQTKQSPCPQGGCSLERRVVDKLIVK